MADNVIFATEFWVNWLQIADEALQSAMAEHLLDNILLLVPVPVDEKWPLVRELTNQQSEQVLVHYGQNEFEGHFCEPWTANQEHFDFVLEQVAISGPVGVILIIDRAPAWIGRCFRNGKEVVVIRMAKEECFNMHLVHRSDLRYCQFLIERVQEAFNGVSIPFEVTAETLEACRALLFALGGEQFQIALGVSEDEFSNMIEACMTNMDSSDDAENGIGDVGDAIDLSEV